MGRGPTGALGDRAEQAAFQFLIERKLRPVARNFRCRGGEIDLIMLEGDCLVFVEVRARRSLTFADPAHTVDYRKQRKLVRTAALFATRNRHYSAHTMRFDVIAVDASHTPGIRWIRDAFRPDDSAF